MKPTEDTVHHWVAAQIAADNAKTCMHFDLPDAAAMFADKARDEAVRVKWEAKAGQQDA